MQSLNIAVFHHHLNRGGVSSVILNQLSALQNLSGSTEIKVVIFYGGRTSLKQQFLESFKDLSLELVELPQLEYDSIRETFSDDSQLASVIEKCLTQRAFEKSNTLLHFHNHSLGKNRAIVPAINQLANSGRRIFLQIHDMAEDFRAANYHRLSSQLPKLNCSIADVLPIASHIQYGVINRRDETILQQTGIASCSIHYLPNSVSASVTTTNHQAAKRKLAKENRLEPDVPLLLYPVRGIGRKNIGEAILLTLIAREPIHVGMTLAPINPDEDRSYQRWKKLCSDLRLPVLFELGQRSVAAFTDTIAAADAIVTTSVAEGFGLVFLESFAFGKPLIGRDIPLITSDFKQSGIQFERLYSEVKIPIELINLTDYDQQLRSALDETYRSFGKPLEIDKYEQHFARMREEGSVDFARLTASEQRAVITAAARDPQIRRLIHNANHVLASWISDTPPKNTTEANAVIDQNRAVIQEKYSASATQTSLFNIYREMIETGTEKVQPNPNPAAVLNYFLSVENFHPIRVSTNQSQGQRSTENKRLQSIVRDSLSEILPLPTGVAPKLFPLSDVKAVIFDIYGTLLVSASGDVGTDPAFSNQGKTADPQLDQMLSDYGTNLQAVSALVRSEIESKHKALRDAGIPFPEIEICSIWQAVLMELARLKAESQRSFPPMAIPSASVREIAIRSELQTNPVWKMPGFDSCLREIQNRKLALGIISNAQFYTPCIIEALAEESLRKLGFADPLSHYSFRIGRGKPDPYLYQLAAKSLQRFDLSPSQVLYVGNDVTKDMIPAKESGFRTGLFAGDKRSLRCGEHGDPQHHDSIDLIFTQLEQITTVLR